MLAGLHVSFIVVNEGGTQYRVRAPFGQGDTGEPGEWWMLPEAESLRTEANAVLAKSRGVPHPFGMTPCSRNAGAPLTLANVL
jgi:hypothetical protein